MDDGVRTINDSLEPDLAGGIKAVLAVAHALPGAAELERELACVERASSRGYFLPDEERLIKLRYSQYLSARAGLLETIEEIGSVAGRRHWEWREKLPVFLTAFAAGCLLMRATRFVVTLAAEKPVVWKKLDEEDARLGIPGMTFTTVYRAAALPATWRRFLAAADFYFAKREEISALQQDSLVGPVVRLLEDEGTWIERRRRDAMKRLFAYRWFSFLRRHRSAWKKVMHGLFKISGSTIAELRQPGVKPAGAPKRITEELRRAASQQLLPGDVVVTRHDDAVSNWFLPGFWPHAALYLGSDGELRELGVEAPHALEEGKWVLEAKKDGVRIRRLEETMHVDAFVVLRSPLERPELAEALRRALEHAGKPYDFLFDFRTSDRLACTEVIYRGFHGMGPVQFHLEEVGGRLCLPAEELLNQALDSGFRVMFSGGLRGDRLLFRTAAEIAFHSSRQHW